MNEVKRLRERLKDAEETIEDAEETIEAMRQRAYQARTAANSEIFRAEEIALDYAKRKARRESQEEQDGE